jgi:transcriptional regulator with XRE-family HTH domain
MNQLLVYDKSGSDNERKEEAMSEFRISLAAARVNANLSQDDVAKILNVSNKTVGNWERGVTIPNAATMMALSRIYKISEDNIFLPCEST